MPGLTRQRGVATLAVAVILVIALALTLVLNASGRWLEQHTAANHTRTSAALQMAEAGVAWTLARLNDNTLIQTSDGMACTPSRDARARPFRDWYAPATPTGPAAWTFDHRPVAGTRLACSVSSTGSLACECPAPGSPPIRTSPAREAFDVLIDDEPSDPEAVRLTVTACINDNAGCSAASRRHSDASARLSTLVKRAPRLLVIPNAPITAGSWVQVCDSMSVENFAASGGGRLVHAGAAAQFGSVHQSSVLLPPSTPCSSTPMLRLTSGTQTSPTSMMATDDARLAALAEHDSSLFRAFFGRSPEHHAEGGCVVGGSSAAERGAAVVAAYRRERNPCRHFVLDGDVEIVGATLGEAATASRTARPVTLVTASHVRLGAGTTMHGVLHLNGRSNVLTMQGATLQGAVLARGTLRVEGTGNVRYDIDTLLAAAASGAFVQVPGAWIDE